MSDKNSKSYLNKFLQAQKQSSSLKLKHSNFKLESEKHDLQDIIEIVKFGIELMKSLGVSSTAEARSKCMTVHQIIHSELLAAGIPTELTIGNVMLREKPFIESMTLQSLIDELESPMLDKPQDIHCWLTLNDSSIIDFTIYSSLTSPDKPECLEDNYVYIEPFEHDSKHYYVPMLVGIEYLVRTG